MENGKYIDVKEVIRGKNASLARWMPSFMLRYVKRIVHEEDINDVMGRIGHLEGLEFVRAALDDLHTTVEVIGAENVPAEGGVVLAANHPLGGLDGIAFMKAVGDVREDFQFLVNDILLNIKNLEPLFVPVNKVGQNPRQATRIIAETFSKDIAILVFPAGLVSRKLPEGITDLEWQKSFITRAIKFKKDVVPVHIEGRNSSFFYNLSRLRSKLGVKANIEMFYLADEMFRQRGKTITVRFGKPIPYQSFDRSKSHQQWAKEVRDIAYALPNK